MTYDLPGAEQGSMFCLYDSLLESSKCQLDIWQYRRHSLITWLLMVSDKISPLLIYFLSLSVSRMSTLVSVKICIMPGVFDNAN